MTRFTTNEDDGVYLHTTQQKESNILNNQTLSTPRNGIHNRTSLSIRDGGDLQSSEQQQYNQAEETNDQDGGISSDLNESENFRSEYMTQNAEFLLDPTLKGLYVALAWDREADVDLSAVCFDSNFEVVEKVWYANPVSKCQSMRLSEDERDGALIEDDESMEVDLKDIPLRVHHIAFIVTIYSADIQHLKQVKNTCFRISGISPTNKRRRLWDAATRTDVESTGMLMAQLTRKKGLWCLKAIGSTFDGRDVTQFLNAEEDWCCLKNSQSESPELRRITVRVLKGSGLAARDKPCWWCRTESSDPFFTISYKDKQFRSKHVSKCLSPVWKEKSFVLGIMTEAETESLKIKVYDYDLGSAAEFLGSITIDGKQLYNLGQGVHQLTRKLQPSTLDDPEMNTVTGHLNIEVTVEIGEISNNL